MTLTAEEVRALEELELAGRPYLGNARNLFLLSVGLRQGNAQPNQGRYQLRGART